MQNLVSERTNPEVRWTIKMKGKPIQVKDISGTSHWAFVLEISTNDDSWTVERRFSDFEVLHQWLATIQPEIYRGISLPSKFNPFSSGIFRISLGHARSLTSFNYGKDEQVAISRVMELDVLIQSLSVHAVINKTWEFAHFLGFYDRVNIFNYPIMIF
eukprot:TRINITY_DN3766_c0_g1_i1.p1 TRINITY_DN3766_c0_g1~~TRINITY_DN3766_c0_g1_i1.p1  ORF type:complete len:158 (+),score=24.90 TRINITY_DN3766_c0_g1_i1:341-814(+)